MSQTRAQIKSNIDANITTNGNEEITGAILRSVLDNMADNLATEYAGYQYAGVATPSTNPGTPDGKAFYLASTTGTYTNFGSLAVAEGEVAVLKYNGSAWSKDVTGAATKNELNQLGQQVIYDVSANNDGATFASLSALLSSENLSTLIPIAVRCGGMSIRFVQSSDNKYVQYRLMNQTFSTTESDWQGVDDVPTARSQNLVKSGGVANMMPNLDTLKHIDAIANVNGIYYGGQGAQSVVIPVKGGELCEIVANTGVVPYLAFITDDNFVGPISYCSGTSTIRSVIYNGVVPSDCKNIILSTKEDGNPHTYLKVLIGDYDYEANYDFNYVVEKVNQLSNISLKERCIDKLKYFILHNNYAIQRKFGIDTSNENVSVLYITLMNLSYAVSGKYTLKMTAYTNAPIADGTTIVPIADGTTIVQKGTGMVEISKYYDLNNSILQFYIFFPAGNYYFRIANIELMSNDDVAYKIIDKLKENESEFNSIILDCWNSFDSTTEGYGVTRFSSMISATEYYKANIPLLKDVVVRCMPGLYRDFETYWPLEPSDSVGINPDDRNCIYQSFDVDVPELTELYWDGSNGGQEVSGEGVWRKAVFQIGRGHIRINGFKIGGINLRYTIHPEDAGNGFGTELLIKNCYLSFGGSPILEGASENRPIIGTGIGVGKRIVIEDCTFNYVGYEQYTNTQFIGGHNNGDDNNNPPHAFKRGGEYVIRNCNCGNLDFSMQCLYNISDSPFKIVFDGCGSIKNVHTFPASGLDNDFKVMNICSDIVSIEED